ncbi:MAG: Stk1 family PASTA domain-containing Ser/Thr kinase [Subdoligranulum sp.]|nr:Stk1 family PASTA domain-containing Ser/Thr kinase [Subdoligranulum sp.]
MDNLIGKILEERYRISELIGTGGMANVYKATDLIDGTVVAVKILREECRSNSELVRRFKNESKAISVLDHPNIVKVFDFSMTEKIQYIIMEYIDGITLKEYMEYRGQPLTYKETLHFITQVLAALQHAHERGIVHRDIKPQNMMLLSDSSIKVMDFGIARFSRSENQTMTDKAIGSVHYISPEQARGGATDAKADLYSVGVMMYEMLSGRLPFESDSPVSVAIKQISDTATPLRELNPAVPEALASITERAMAKDPRERYPSAQAMLADIDEFKRNPSVKFEYQYLTDSAPTRYVDKVMSKTADKQGTARRTASSKNTAPRNGQRKPKKKKKRRLLLPILAGMAAAFLIGSSILVYWIFKEQSNGMFSPHEDVELPNFIGLSYDQIKEQYKDSQFYFKEESEYNEQYAAGLICDQYPRAQTADNPKIVKDNAVITLTVSKGVQVIEMPNLAGMTRAEATAECRRLGLLPTFRSVLVPPGQSSGFVMSTDPLVGTSVEANTSNSKVTVYISQQEMDKSATVPNLVGMTTLEDAQTALKNAMLVLGAYTEEYSDTVPAGAIISQDPVEGSPARWNDSVSVVVSKGPEERTRTITLTVSHQYKTGDAEFDISSQPYRCFFNDAQVGGEWIYPSGSAGPQGTSWSITSTGSGTVRIEWGGQPVWSNGIDFGPGGGDVGYTDDRGNDDTRQEPSKAPEGGDEDGGE